MQSSKFTKIDEEFVCENCGRVVVGTTVHIVYIQNIWI